MALDYAQELRRGLLAVHLGYCGSDDLCAAILRWSANADRPLLDWLVADGRLRADVLPRVRTVLEERLRGPQASLWQDPRFGDYLADVEAACRRAGPPLDGVLPRLFDPAAVLAIADSIVDPAATTPSPAADVRLEVDPAVGAAPCLGAHPTDARFAKVDDPGKQGGMGKIYVGVDREFDRPVALKEILAGKYLYRNAEDRADLLQRFEHEARITARLQHPGVVPVYGIGKLDSGLPYFAMRYLDRGQTLQEKIKEYHDRPSDARDPGERQVQFRGLLSSFVAACRTVEYAHQQGVLHRDLKPANILCGEFGETLVLDWGLTPLGTARGDSSGGPGRVVEPPQGERETPAVPRAADPDVTTAEGGGPLGGLHTRVSIGVGTPGYVSPEQLFGPAEGGHVGRPTDVFSLGASLLHLLLGARPPFLAELPGGQVGFQKDAPADLAGWEAVPRALRAICLKAMSLSIAERYPTAQALAEDVERWLADQPVSAWNDANEEPLTDQAQRWLRHNPRKVSGVLALLSAGVVALPALLHLQNSAHLAQQAQLASQGRENLQRAATAEILDVVDDELGASAGGAAIRHAMLLAVVETCAELQSTAAEPAESLLDPLAVARAEFESRRRLGLHLRQYVLTDPIAAEGADEAAKQQLRVVEQQAAQLAAAEFETALALARQHADAPQFPVAERLVVMELLCDLYLDPDLNQPRSAIAVLTEAVALLSAPGAVAGAGSPGQPLKTDNAASLGMLRLKLVRARLLSDRATEGLLAGLPDVAAFGVGRRAEAARVCERLAAEAAARDLPELALQGYALGIELVQTCPDAAERGSAAEHLVKLTLEAARFAGETGRAAESSRYAALALGLLRERRSGDLSAHDWFDACAALDCYAANPTALDDAEHRASALAVGEMLARRLLSFTPGQNADKRWRLPPAWLAIGVQLWNAGRCEAALQWIEHLIPALQQDPSLLLTAELARLHQRRGIWLVALERPTEAEQALADALRAFQAAPGPSDLLQVERAETWLHLELLHWSQSDEPSARAARAQALSELAPIAWESWNSCGQQPPTEEQTAEVCLSAAEALCAHLQSLVVEREQPEELQRLVDDALEAWSVYDFERVGELLSAALQRGAWQLALDERESIQRRAAACRAIEEYLDGVSHALDELSAQDRLFAFECCARHWLEQGRLIEAVDLAERIVNDEQGAPTSLRLIAAARIYALAYERRPLDDPADLATAEVEPDAWEEWCAEAIRLLRAARTGLGAGAASGFPLPDEDFASLREKPGFRELLRNAPRHAREP